MKSFKLQCDKTILLLQYHKLTREQNENAEEWMDHLRLKVNVCAYKERGKRLKEQFKNSTSYEEMMTEIIR